MKYKTSIFTDIRSSKSPPSLYLLSDFLRFQLDSPALKRPQEKKSMSYPTLGIQASLQFSPMNLMGSAGPQSQFDLHAAFHRHHHGHHDCGNDQAGNCGPSGHQDRQLGDAARSLMQAGQQLVQQGQQLMQHGDFRQGMQLVREGTQLERQAARLEQQAGHGNQSCGPTSPHGSDDCHQGDPCNPAGDHHGGPSHGDHCDNGGQYGQYGNGYGDQGDCSCGHLSVDGNSVNTGGYTIKASTDNGGTLQVTDNTTGKNFKVWGDPHISTDDGDSTDFQH